MEKCPVCGATPQDVHLPEENGVMCLGCVGQGMKIDAPLEFDSDAVRAVRRNEAAPWVKEAVYGVGRTCEHCGGTGYCPSFAN